MQKNIFIWCGLLLAFVACKHESVHYTIARPEDQMHICASSSDVVLDVNKSADTAIVFSWQWPDILEGSTGYSYYFKMDIADNNMQTSISKMPLEKVNTLAFTHRQLNDMLSTWNIPEGTQTMLEAELLAVPAGMAYYVKPMMSTLTFQVTGYASVLFMAGTATAAGNDWKNALSMSRISGSDAYLFAGLLQPGTLVFPTAKNDTAMVYGKGIMDNDLLLTRYNAVNPFLLTRTGYYHVIADIGNKKFSCIEPLYIVGDATPGGWSLAEASEMTNITDNKLSWKGNLTTGELKFACVPSSGLFEDPFYQAAAANTPADGITAMVFNPDGKGLDNKWLVTKEGIYTIEVDLYQRTATFTRDKSMDDVPFKQVWLIGDATPGGWNCPFTEQMTYDEASGHGTFKWIGTLTAGEIKFPLQNSDWGGAFFMADSENKTVQIDTQMSLSYAKNGQPDHKFIVTEAGEYTILLNVINQTVKFIKK